MADHVDGFLLDAFGVLNIGETAIPVPSRGCGPCVPVANAWSC
ncbi:MAG: hypothetical protein R3D63_10540 [Paracoccaceae bacterium]